MNVRKIDRICRRPFRLSFLGTVLCVLVVKMPVLAAGPYFVHRALAPENVGNGPPHAVVSNGPFEDAPGVLSDGESYFYRVTDPSLQAVPISVHKNPISGTIRLGFDDQNNSSAAVDATFSTVVVLPAVLPADGVALATVTITPLDGSGIPLGSGLDVTVDGSALWPGNVIGSVADMGNGDYVVQVLSTIPGTGDVWVTVEGIPLSDEPTITFESSGPPLSLRELGIQQLIGLTGPNGTFEKRTAGLNHGRDVRAQKVGQAWSQALTGLSMLQPGSSDNDVDVIGGYLKGSIANLVAALNESGAVDPVGISNLIENLLNVSRLVALHHLSAAQATCGTCQSGSGEPATVCDAEDAMTAAEAARATGPAGAEDAASQYSTSIDKSLSALLFCG